MIYNGVLIPAVQQSDSTIHTHTSFFKSSFSLWFIAEYRIQFSVLYSRTLFIHLLYMYSFSSNGGQVGCLSWHSCSRLSAYSTISAKLMREGASLVAQMVKKFCLQCRRSGFHPCVPSMATHSSILAWNILWTQSLGSQRVRHD